MKATAILLVLGALGIALAFHLGAPPASDEVEPASPAVAPALATAATAPAPQAAGAAPAALQAAAPEAAAPPAAAPEAAALPAAAPEAAGPGAMTAQAHTPEPVARESAAYPWEEFEDILGRELTARERDALRDLRKEHGLRLAETHARMQRGELERAEYDRWRASRAAQFRSAIARTLDCSTEQVAALLRVPMRSAAVP
jgi:hypothetical protein